MSSLRPLRIAGLKILPGETRETSIRIARLYDHTEMHMPVKVLRGVEDGPRLFVCAAIHGDEINGVEIIRRLLRRPSLRKLRGTLIAVPVVNVFGFNRQSRYLPDRRDLNRMFPGSADGSLASRLAHIVMKEIVSKSTHGIDLHTGAIHRKNLPQIRACVSDDRTRELAFAFGAPVIIDARLRRGSLRKVALQRKVPTLLYEGGEAHRFDEASIRGGVRGILAVMRTLGMLPPRKTPPRRPFQPFLAKSSHWVRAPRSGILTPARKLGALVQSGGMLGSISSPLGNDEAHVYSDYEGIVIGETRSPLVNRGDALFHVATFEQLDPSIESLEGFDERYDEF